MYLLTVNNEVSAAALASRAAGSNSNNPAVVQQLAQALTSSNPQVDFNNLRPGTLLIVPNVTGVDPTTVDNRMNPVVDNVIQYLTSGLSDVAGRLQNNASGTLGNRTDLANYLGAVKPADTASQAAFTTLVNQWVQTINPAQAGQQATWAVRFTQAQTQVNSDLGQLGNNLK